MTSSGSVPERPSLLLPARLRATILAGLLFLLVLPGIWLGAKIRSDAQKQAEQQLTIETETMFAALEYGDLPWLGRVIERTSLEFSGRDRRVAASGSDIFGSFGTATDRKVLEGLQFDRPTIVTLSTGKVRVLRQAAADHAQLKGKGYGDVTVTVARAYPSAIETAASWTIGIAIAALLATVLTGSGFYAWYSKHYRQRLDAVNAHLDAVGKGAFNRLDLDGPVPEEIDALKRNLNIMINELGQQFTGLQSFVGSAAHELRTPLARMLLSVESMQGNSTNDLAEDIKGIKSDTLGLRSLLEALLEIGKYQINRFDTSHFKPIALSQLLAVIAEDFEDSFDKQGMRLDSEITPRIDVVGEVPLVRRLVENILENARKYGNASVPVSLILSAVDDSFVLTIESGGGFPKDIRETAFVIGRRSASVSNKPGLGLGLSLVDIVAKKHGWRVELGGSDDVARVVMSGPLVHESGIKLQT